MYTSDDLIASVTRYANVPTSQITFQIVDFLAFADDSIRSKMIPLILKHQEEFYVKPFDYTLTAGTSAYAIPPRAINMKLRSVQLIDAVNKNSRYNLERLNIEGLYGTISGGIGIQKNGFYFEGNNVVLYPAPAISSSTLLRLNYYIRPNSLVSVSACAQVASVNLTANTITCVSVPSTWSSLNTFDIVKSQPGFDCTAIDQSAVSINSGVITFTSALPTNISVGDYVCLANQSCVVQVPPELQPLLTQYVVIRCLTAQGDNTALKNAMGELEMLEKNASLLLAPRADGSVKRVVKSRSISRLV